MWSSRRPIIFFPLSIKKVIESTWSLFLKTIHGFYKALYLSRLKFTVPPNYRNWKEQMSRDITIGMCPTISRFSNLLNKFESLDRYCVLDAGFRLPARLWFPVRIHLNISTRSDGTCIVKEMIMSAVVETEDAPHKKYYLENYSQLFL